MKKALSLILLLALSLSLTIPSLAALNPTTVEIPYELENVENAFPPNGSIAPIMVTIADENYTYEEQEDTLTLYEVSIWNGVLIRHQLSGLYSLKGGSEITVSHPGDDPSTVFYVTLEKFTKSAEPRVVEYYEDFNYDQSYSEDFQGKYFMSHYLSTYLSNSEVAFEEDTKVEAIPAGNGHYWNFGGFGFYFDEDAHEVEFSDQGVDAILFHPGDSATFTIPDGDSDTIYQVCATVIYPKYLSYHEFAYAFKVDNDSAAPAPGAPTTPSAPVPNAVMLSLQNLTVDGESVECEKYNIDGSNYFKLRDLAQLLDGTGSQFGVGFDEETSTVSITTGEAYETTGTELVTGADNSASTQPSSQTILINGEAHGELTVYNIGGSNFFQLRELGTLLDFEVDYDVDSNTAIVRSIQK